MGSRETHYHYLERERWENCIDGLLNLAIYLKMDSNPFEICDCCNLTDSLIYYFELQMIMRGAIKAIKLNDCYQIDNSINGFILLSLMSYSVLKMISFHPAVKIVTCDRFCMFDIFWLFDASH